MSKPRLTVSLVIGLTVLAATGWWALKTFWLIAPLGSPPASWILYQDFWPPGTEAFPSLRGTVEAGVKPPVPVYEPLPPYTPKARKDKVEGMVELSAAVDARGNVADVKLVRGVGEGLDENAVETVRKWKFGPALKKGHPVPVKVTVEINFALH
jgi:TonB family protein